MIVSTVGAENRGPAALTGTDNGPAPVLDTDAIEGDGEGATDSGVGLQGDFSFAARLEEPSGESGAELLLLLGAIKTDDTSERSDVPTASADNTGLSGGRRTGQCVPGSLGRERSTSSGGSELVRPLAHTLGSAVVPRGEEFTTPGAKSPREDHDTDTSGDGVGVRSEEDGSVDLKVRKPRSKRGRRKQGGDPKVQSSREGVVGGTKQQRRLARKAKRKGVSRQAGGRPVGAANDRNIPTESPPPMVSHLGVDVPGPHTVTHSPMGGWNDDNTHTDDPSQTEFESRIGLQGQAEESVSEYDGPHLGGIVQESQSMTHIPPGGWNDDDTHTDDPD